MVSSGNVLIHVGAVLVVGTYKIRSTYTVFIHYGVGFLHYFQRRVSTSGQNPRVACNKPMGTQFIKNCNYFRVYEVSGYSTMMIWVGLVMKWPWPIVPVL